MLKLSFFAGFVLCMAIRLGSKVNNRTRLPLSLLPGVGVQPSLRHTQLLWHEVRLTMNWLKN